VSKAIINLFIPPIHREGKKRGNRGTLQGPIPPIRGVERGKSNIHQRAF